MRDAWQQYGTRAGGGGGVQRLMGDQGDPGAAPDVGGQGGGEGEE